MRLRRSAFACLEAAMLGLAVVVGGLALPGPAAHAVTPDEILPDKNLEARAREISSGLRCLVCQNQSIDDSDAPLAHDLRLLVRERLKAGDTDLEIRDFVVARYGEFVLLKPPFSAETALLWLMPLLMLAGAGLMIWKSAGSAAARRVEGPGANPLLTPDEQAQLDALLSDDPRSPPPTDRT